MKSRVGIKPQVCFPHQVTETQTSSHLATKLGGFKRPALSTRSQVRNTNLISEPRVATSSRVSGSDRSESFNQLRRNLRGPVLTAIGKKKVPP